MRLAKEEKQRLNIQIDLFTKNFKMLNHELRLAQSAEDSVRQTNMRLLNRQLEMEAELKGLRAQDKDMKKEVIKHRARIVDQNDEIGNLKALNQMFETFLAKKNAKNKARKVEHKKGGDLISLTLAENERQQDAAINRNIMVGEDFRSQALENYHKITELQDDIVVLKAAPTVVKKRYL